MMLRVPSQNRARGAPSDIGEARKGKNTTVRLLKEKCHERAAVQAKNEEKRGEEKMKV